MTFNTEQENFWAGKFGDEYIKRNEDNNFISNNLYWFAKILTHTSEINRVIEFGANIGLNIMALKKLLPLADFSAVEINEEAQKRLMQIDQLKVYKDSLLNFKEKSTYDLVLIKGVLIHIAPEKLDEVYEILYNASDKYICLMEYYNPVPMAIPYRGYSGKLFKRDFAGEMLEKFKDLQLIDYGFMYHKDNNFPQDDITWFLLKKQS